MTHTLMTMMIALTTSVMAALAAKTQHPDGVLPETVLQEQIAQAEKVSISEAAWLVGRWVGSNGDDEYEEIWSPADDGRMSGSFRWSREGKVLFYEFFVLLEVGDTLELRLKHFNPDMTGWEQGDKYITFRLKEATDTELRFGGMTLSQRGPDRMRSVVHVRQNDDVSELSFDYRRAPFDSAPPVDKLGPLTPIILMDDVAAGIKFWQSIGFEVDLDLSGTDGRESDFAILHMGRSELMLQQPGASKGVTSSTRVTAGTSGAPLYLEMPEPLDALLPQLRNLPVVVERQQTHYGMDEIAVRVPGDVLVIFAYPLQAQVTDTTDETSASHDGQ